jgi:kumamolisin
VVGLGLLAANLIPAQAATPATTRLAQSDTTPGLLHADKLRRTDPRRQLTVGVNLALRNAAELEAFISQVSDRKSPNYGHYLTPDQFAATYGPTQSQIQQVVDHLRASGLSVSSVSSNRTIVEATGPVSAVEAAFSVTISDWHDRDQNRDFYGNDNEPTLPAAIASYVVGVAGLNNHYPLHRLGPAPRVGGGPAGGYTPNELKKAYDVTPLASAGYNGSGQRLGLFELDGFRQSNITAYDTQYGLGSPAPTRVVVSPGPGPLGNGEIEVELDIEVMHAIAPASPITVWEGQNTDTGANATYNAMVTSNTTKSNSTSWGLCEPNTTTSEMTTLDNIFKQAAAQGQSFYAASGDNGAYDCGTSSLAVDSPASDPYITATGGTNLALSADGSYQSESAWSDRRYSPPAGSGGGLSGFWARPSWQTGPGVVNTYSNGKRQVPDVALDADPQTGYSVYVTYAGSTGWNVVGGTSAAAPVWAAFTGVYNQYAAANGKPNLGYANPTLYSTGSFAQAYPPYHDITTGDNLYYSTTAGWDYPTGWGSFDANNLARDLAGTLALSSVQASSITSTSAVITWQTDHPANSVVDYGTTTSYGSRVVDTTNTTNHSLTLSPLTNNTTYHFRSTSTDAYGNSGSSSDGTFTTARPCGSVTLAATPVSPQAAGTTVSFTAGATGCTTPQFRFWVGTPAGAWTIVQDYSSNAAFVWNTAGLAPGTYTIWLDAHSVGGTGSEASTEILYSIESGPSCSGLSVSASPGSPQPIGTAIRFTASATGCTTPQYRFWVGSPSGVWTVVQNYSPSATLNWATAGLAPGSYTIWLDVHALGGTGTEASARTLFSIESGPSCGGLGVSASPGSPEAIGTAISFTASATGCTTPQYRFWVGSPSGVWTVVQDYSPNTTFNWTTAGLAPGTYTIWLDVHALGGTGTEAFARTLFSIESGPSCSGLSVSASPGSPQPIGTAISFTASASGCITPQYRFWVGSPSGIWTVVQDYSPNATFNWATAGLGPGSYTIWLDVHALGGTGTEAFTETIYALR